jgi:hypothetical protein
MGLDGFSHGLQQGLEMEIVRGRRARLAGCGVSRRRSRMSSNQKPPMCTAANGCALQADAVSGEQEIENGDRETLFG